MKTPPNSKDELDEDDDFDEVFPVFREGARFGKLHLEVGMKFNIKWNFKELVENYDAYDSGANSDDTNSWLSLKMKTPPNSKDELDEDDDFDEIFLVFKEGARFGKLHLDVGMKFNTKWNFKKIVRDYTI
ncbi:hypothetical protein Ahy_A05g025108 [Arachis hypogaea]|uniref:Uncharacterized protein n=1 Tax=Arachis hypogaea TaxID=3818 RepID=A0A445D805_ARAHY|nr:hypothetical protein Ahy_A05g025108 [Arachis hypogaea]